MSVNFVTPMELYHAAREVCLRLYVLNGGDARATWTVKPFPGTAAIVCKFPAYGPPEFTLGMPAFPIGARRTNCCTRCGPIGTQSSNRTLKACTR
jgi:hypothetical protein